MLRDTASGCDLLGVRQRVVKVCEHPGPATTSGYLAIPSNRPEACPMADEQTPQSDLIDDAIRQAEKQLEQKLEALRMSALGEPAPREPARDADVAILRPTGTDTAADDIRGALANATSHHDTAWRETEGDDVTFAPVGGLPVDARNDLDVPDVAKDHFDTASRDFAPDAHISELVAIWDEEDGEDDGHAMFDTPNELTSTSAHDGQITPTRGALPSDEVRDAMLRPTSPSAPRPEADWARPQPVHASWTARPDDVSNSFEDPASPTPIPASTSSGGFLETAPSEDELQFWAQTRTALRDLRQLTGAVPHEVVGEVVEQVSGEMQRLLTDELTSPNTALRAIQQQVSQGFPKVTERLEAAIEHGVAGPQHSISQLREEIPAQLDRSVRETRSAIREDLDRTAATVHGSVQKDVAQLEQSIATNVTRMAQGMTDTVGRVERDLDALGDNVVRFERGVHSEFDRVEAQLRASIERVEGLVRDELIVPTETIKKLDEELPARFGRVERTLVEQVQTTQHELTSVLTNLVDANRASLDRIASVASTLDEDRARRAEDTELIVDTVATGWEGLAGAMKSLYEQAADNAMRIAAIEQRLSQIRDLETAVDATMEDLRSQVRDLAPAPVVVTVSHPEAEVRNTARGGWLPDTQR